MAGPQQELSVAIFGSPGRHAQNHILESDSEGKILTSPSAAVLPPQRQRRVERDIPQSFDSSFGGRLLPRTTLDSDLTLPSEILYSEPREPQPAITHSRAVVIYHYIWGMLCMIYSAGMYRVYYARFRLKDREGGSRLEVIYDSNYAQWAKTVRRMCGIWRLVRVGCGLLLPVSIALLQINGVIDSVFARTCTIVTAIFSGAGLLTSGVYLFHRQELKDEITRRKWAHASRHPSEMESIEFWTCLALPVISLIWSILFCAVTVVCIAWTKPNSIVHEKQSTYIASAVFVTALSLTTLVHLYKAAGLVVWDAD
ncbi:hypothetical protein GALMADRAFT_145609 [Galerina marginata CBS 339.88]|uniref:Transmembrane protein n=1 Tax=Galerina marginata (strain CBS 339.88) TaxID=685588 RepID=A0A067SQY9_GALM3|nr:hypothetical protein GALMADRAFT_145609 [Galerina marginata CBS 339.88]